MTATVRDIHTLVERTIRAQYLVACDGNRSPIREDLGIAMRGHGLLSRSVTIYFRADCSHALRGRNLGVIYVHNPQVRGFFRLEKTGLGGFLVVFTVGDINEPGARYVADIATDELAVQMVREAVGEPDLEVHVEDVDKWRAVADVADTFQAGRVFLAGDAAHTMPPTGGFGGNTGIQDAHNLAWKLALVIKGQADPRLLESYDAERQPAGTQAVEQAYNRYVLRSDPDLGLEGVQEAIPDMHVEFNRYRSRAVVPDADDVDDGAPDIDPRQSFGRPGTRAPHVVLERGDELISTLDLFGNGFVLLAGPDGGGWPEAARAASETAGVEVTAFVVERAGGSGAAGRSSRRRCGAVLDGVRRRAVGRLARPPGRLRRLAPGRPRPGRGGAARRRPRGDPRPEPRAGRGGAVLLLSRPRASTGIGAGPAPGSSAAA